MTERIIGTVANAEFLDGLRKAKASKREGKWVPVPEIWGEELIRRGATAADWAIAYRLIAMARWAPGRRVILGNEKVEWMGYSGRTRRRSLKRFAEWSLVALERKAGATPRVRVKWMD